MMIPVGSTYLAGLLLGVRHALEPDHIAAVTTLITRERAGRSTALIGAAWGIGHGLPLVLLCGLLTAFGELPSSVAWGAELSAALALIVLGISAIHRALTAVKDGVSQLHHHGSLTHVHGGPEEHLHVAGWTVARRPFAFGLLHGIAGSGALATLVSLSIPSLGQRLLYVALLAGGAAATMVLLTALAPLPRADLGDGSRPLRWLRGCSGMASVVIGMIWALPLLIG